MMQDIKIDKTEWKKVKFGDVCRLINHSSRNPKTEGFQHVVGLEHIEPDNLHIRSYGSTEDETTFTRIFRKGQVLFGRRRAYQRKVAYTGFDGICSGDIMVFEAIREKLVSELLPFIVQSDGFFNCAINTSAGSLSPRTKFADLANYEFFLPPKEEQVHLAELLWAADEVVEKNNNIFEIISNTKYVIVEDFFKNVNSCKNFKLGNLCIIPPSYGANMPAIDYKDGTPRYVRITDINENGVLNDFDKKGVEYVSEDKYKLQDQDLLIARTAVPGKPFLYEKEMGECVFAGYLIRFRLNKKYVIPKYVYCYTQSSSYQSWIKKTIKTGTVSNINAQEYSSMEIPIPDFGIQNELIRQFDNLVDNIKGIKKNLILSQQLKTTLINRIF